MGGVPFAFHPGGEVEVFVSRVARAGGDGRGGEYVGFEAGGDGGGGNGVGALGGGGECPEDARGGYRELAAGEGGIVLGLD